MTSVDENQFSVNTEIILWPGTIKRLILDRSPLFLLLLLLLPLPQDRRQLVFSCFQFSLLSPSNHICSIQFELVGLLVIGNSKFLKRHSKFQLRAPVHPPAHSSQIPLVLAVLFFSFLKESSSLCFSIQYSFAPKVIDFKKNPFQKRKLIDVWRRLIKFLTVAICC